MKQWRDPEFLQNVLFGILCCCGVWIGGNWAWEHRDKSSYTGHGFLPVRRLYLHEYPWDLFLGDGGYEYVDSIGQADSEWFAHPDAEFFKYPWPGRDSANYDEVQHWTATPLGPKQERIVWFAMHDAQNPQMAAVEAALHQPGAYYAYAIDWLNDDIVENIVFLFLSPKSRKFAMVVSLT